MKKYIFLLLAVLLCISLSACGEDPQSETILEWGEHNPFPEGSTVDRVVRIGDTFLVAGTYEEKPIAGLVDYTLTDDDGVRFGATKPVELDAGRFSGMCAGGDGFFYLVTSDEPAPRFEYHSEPSQSYPYSNYYWSLPEGYTGHYSVLKYSPEGELLDRLEIENWAEDCPPEIAVGHEGELVLWGEKNIWLLSWEGGYEAARPLYDVLRNDAGVERIYLLNVDLCTEGLVAAVTFSGGSRYYRIHADGTILHLPMDTHLSLPDNPYMLRGLGAKPGTAQGYEGEYLWYGAEFAALYFSSGTAEYVMTWNPIGADGFEVSDDRISTLCRVAEKTFVCTMQDDNTALHTVQEKTVTATPRSEVKVALYACPNNDSMRSLLNEFSAENGIYSYTCESYGIEEADRLLAEISSKNAPDLIISGHKLDTSSGYFEDLYPYLDADPELSRDSFLPNLLDAISVDGRLTDLWTSASVTTVMVRAADAKGKATLTPEDYTRLMEENDEYKWVFTPVQSKENLLDSVVRMSMTAYIDKDDSTCRFDAPAFAELLRWVNESGSDWELDDPVPEWSFQDVAAYVTQIYTPTSLGTGIWKEPVAFVGAPVGDLPGHIYNNAGGISMSIAAKGDNKEGAWAYIRDQLSFDTQYENRAKQELPSLPVHYEALKKLAEEHIEKEDMQLFLDLLSKTTYAENYADDRLWEIVSSCAMAYLNDEKTLEETVNLIQNRASVYMAEQYG